MPPTTHLPRKLRTLTLVAVTAFFWLGPIHAAHAQVVPTGIINSDASSSPSGDNTPVVDPTATRANEGSTEGTSSSSSPAGPNGPTGPTANPGKASISVNFGDVANKPSQSVLIIILITMLSIAPALLLMLTSFTRIVIVLSLTRNALGVQAIPPSQVLVGLALFLSLFIMGPTFSKINKDALQPFLHGKITQTVAFEKGSAPIKTFMLKHTRRDELGLFLKATKSKQPGKPNDVSLSALVPAFIVSELKTAFIIGFVVFIPFLVIDLIVSSSLMSMGMMMLPPIMVSMPFKLLLFVLVDGWGLITRSLLTSFRT